MGIVLKYFGISLTLNDNIVNGIMATRLLLLAILTMVLAGCATTQQEVASDNSSSAEQKTADTDPYEGFNRTIFGFNNGVDTYFLKPVTKAYRFVAPEFVEQGVSNFFGNLLEVRNILNAVLQGKGSKAATYTGRFLLNSTVGIGGLFDPATAVGIEKADGEDFGQTLATWGVESGPYIVLPFFGPSNVRDGLSIPVDMYADPVTYLEDTPSRDGLHFLEIVDARSKLLDAENLLTGDKYIFIRDAYLQRRQYLIKDGEVKDTFGDNIKGDF